MKNYQSKIYTTKTGSKVLGYAQDTLKCYAIKYGVGTQPGGPGTPYLFTTEDLMYIRDKIGKPRGRNHTHRDAYEKRLASTEEWDESDDSRLPPSEYKKWLPPEER